MSFERHLFALASIPSSSADQSPYDASEWASRFDQFPTSPANGQHITSSPLPPSVLDIYQPVPSSSSTNGQGEVEKLVTRFMSNPDRKQLATTLAELLLSSRPDDSISNEVLELIGYDDIELVMEMLAFRRPVGMQLANPSAPMTTPVSSSSHTHVMPTNVSEEPSSVNGKKKKGKFRVVEEETSNNRMFVTPEEARRNMANSLRSAADRPLASGGVAQPEVPVYPNVYTSTSATSGGNVLSSLGSKFMLPLGTTRNMTEDWEEVTIPPARTVPPRVSERPILISELDPLAKGSFPGYQTLNRIQSIVFPTAYGTNENLLICAPTGAGKTDVAMLTILRVLDQYSNKKDQALGHGSLAASIRRDDFKIIYVAPMKALAAEIVRKLGKRLKWLNIVVKELTGDMQLTRAEIAETQIIVTTPEKWDVVTRKPTGEGELASKVKLLIIDEVHLLNEDRGAVIETIVARTLRQVESTQSLIRVVGLSATLPNYIDVAAFLRVSPYQGLFFFDSSFRPVPLEQHFIGVKGKPNSPTSRKNLDRATFDKVSELVAEGHQVMVFVHARKETVKSAQALRESILHEGNYEDFDPSSHPQFEQFRREIGTSRNKEMKMLFDHGFGIHHAGMLRSDRNMMERMFEARAIKVLCCTATLAWGVNLPAHAVIIKGTQVYDAGKGAFVDLSVLDVLQIFGRAGRPGMETSGVGYICTTDDKLDHYLDAIMAQHPIESQFVGGMIDSLNAEVALGTVTNVSEGVEWVGYTYLFVRMKKNPMVYGLLYDELIDDPNLGSKRQHLITAAAKKLADAGMISFDQLTGQLTITDLGRIAAKYYIRHTSIEIYNKEFRPTMTEADVLAMLAMSTEFDQIQVRESELDELKVLMDEIIPCQVKGGTDTSQGKVNILLQGYITNAYVEDFALVSDTAYAAQNGGRIMRALLEIALSRKWANVSAVLMSMSKAVEKRMWPFENPMKQFNLQRDTMYNLQQWADDLSPAELAAHSAAELGTLIHLNERHGAAVLAAAKQFPSGLIAYALRPLSAELLKISIRVTPAFEWNTKLHGGIEPFWIWVEDHRGVDILQWAHLNFRPSSQPIDLEFVIPIRGVPPPSVTVRFLSDRWLGAEDEILIPFDTMVMPATSTTHTARLEIPFIAPLALQHPALSTNYGSRIRVFNGIQTQCFWPIYNTVCNVLLAAPASSGKSTVGQLAIWRSILKSPTKSCLVVCPLDMDARDYASTLGVIGKGLDAQIQVHTISSKTNLAHRPRGVNVVTPSCLLSWMESGRISSFTQNLSLVLCENLEMLGPTYELAISLLLHATQSLPVRFIGITASLTHTSDLATWLRVSPENVYDFRPSDRDQSLTNVSHTFTIPHSSALLKAMMKPVHAALRAVPPTEQGVLFVPSRAQCRAVAVDLITECAIEMDTRGFLGPHTSSEEMEYRLNRLKDRSLVDPLLHGIGIYHTGLAPSDRVLTLELFADGFVRVLVVPREGCWNLPVRAGVVCVMGTQYLQISSPSSGGEREKILRNYSMHELVRMQGLGVRHGRSGAFHLLCQAEERDTFMRFLEEGLPLESKLLYSSSRLESDLDGGQEERDVLRTWLAKRRENGSIRGKQDMMDILGFTFLARRMKSNPVYYDSELGGRDASLSRMCDELFALTIPAPTPLSNSQPPTKPAPELTASTST